ncbi:MAG: hypothetical protein WCA33_00660, partial [Candidatus Acidiferrales bacterium]
TGQPNKLSGLKKGVEQSNLLADLGFHQVYCYVFIVVDSRELNVSKFAFAGSTKEIKSLLEREIGMAATALRSTAELTAWVSKTLATLAPAHLRGTEYLRDR